MHRLNAYDKERVPALGNAKFQRFTGVAALATLGITGRGRETLYAYAKPSARKIDLEEYDRWHKMHASDWALLPAFELKKTSATFRTSTGP